MLAPVDNPAALRRRQNVDFCQQRPAQRRLAVGEQVHKHRTASGDFARLKRARALVAFQAEKLKPVSKGHSDFIVMPADRFLRSRLGRAIDFMYRPYAPKQ
jgi:hypothetical protein